MERIYGVIVPPRVPCRIVALVALEMARAEPHALPIARSPPQAARESASQARKRRRGGKGVRRGGKGEEWEARVSRSPLGGARVCVPLRSPHRNMRTFTTQICLCGAAFRYGWPARLCMSTR